LTEFVTKLQNLNDIQLDVIQQDIDDVIDDPEQYGKDYIEFNIIKFIKFFKESYNLGKKLGKEIKDA
tara:strand:+ start:8863 stop:9063 length:201 start_codon:yes stop_codon:yes gene_type:complete